MHTFIWFLRRGYVLRNGAEDGCREREEVECVPEIVALLERRKKEGEETRCTDESREGTGDREIGPVGASSGGETENICIIKSI